MKISVSVKIAGKHSAKLRLCATGIQRVQMATKRAVCIIDAANECHSILPLTLVTASSSSSALQFSYLHESECC
jgi:hypothetical protein